MTALQQPANSLTLARELVLPAVAMVAIAVSSDIRMPLGLPGHRGLVWLTLLVAVALVTRRRETVVAVGVGSTLTTLMLHTGPGPGGVGSLRYLAAAVLLYALASAPMARTRPWLLVIAAAPIHLVALAGTLVHAGMAEKALFHLGFGLVAGLLGWAIAVGINWGAPPLAVSREE